MTGPFRLAAGGRIDRGSSLAFRFDGLDFAGHPGDTLASALLASGVRLFGRSFKYHRPRGVFTAGPEEPCALVELRSGARREPNLPAPAIELFAGLEAASQNRWPSLQFDIGAVNDLFSPMLTAGFYYKTFMAPGALWEKLYEPLIRKAAGLGRAAVEPDPDRYDTVHVHCDTLVVGSGRAGLTRALAAAQAGERVILIEQDFELGGAMLLDPQDEGERLALVEALQAQPEVTLLTRTSAFGVYDGLVVGAVERVGDHLAEPGSHQVRQRRWVIRPKRLALATGSLERLIAFPGNDRPGVMLASAAQTYATRFAVAPGRKAAFFLNNDAAYASAFLLAGCGVEIAAIVDVRDRSEAGEEALARGLPVIFGGEVVATHGTPLKGVTIGSPWGGRRRRIEADLLCVSGGFNPQVQLASQAGLPLAWDEAGATYVARSAGAIEILGTAAEEGTPLKPSWEIRSRASGKAFVDLQHDVTSADIRLAQREGYGHVEHLKRYTTHGMATDQGKTGGLVGSAILAQALGQDVSTIGLPTFRPYAAPVSFGALAGGETGEQFKPKRRLPLHDWHEHNGAVFVRLGLWLRPLVYSPTGDTSWAPVLEEARAVRRSVGVTDVSSLGKIDVQGTDAGLFLDRLYANTFSTLPVGRARYGLMLREDGIMFDDGTTSRLAEDHFFLTTTTANAAAALEHMEFHHQTVWRELDVQLSSVSDQWAQFAVAGPDSRSLLAGLVDIDLADEAFPFMAAAPARIAGIEGRLIRISFSGEMAFEVSVPAAQAEYVWEAILLAGERFSIRPYGLDALNLLRIEKGHVAGSELNGQTTAVDLGLGKMLKKKGDFVGRALVGRPGLVDPARPSLVGVRPTDPAKKLRAGAVLLSSPQARESQGFVTAACMATESDGFIGLALLSGGAARIGETLHAADPVRGEACDVAIVSPHFVDPANERVKDASEPVIVPVDLAERVEAEARPAEIIGHGEPTLALESERLDCAELFARRDQEADLRAAFRHHFNIDLPGPGRTLRAGTLRLSSIGPGAWLISDERGALGGLAGSIKHAVDGRGSVVDQSSGLVMLRLTGPQSRFVLSKLCRVDLHPKVFGTDAVARTLLGQVQATLYSTSDNDGFEILVPATFSRSLAESLLEAAAEFGCVYSG